MAQTFSEIMKPETNEQIVSRVTAEFAEVFDWAESDFDFDDAAQFLVQCNPGLVATKVEGQEIYTFSMN